MWPSTIQRLPRECVQIEEMASKKFPGSTQVSSTLVVFVLVFGGAFGVINILTVSDN